MNKKILKILSVACVMLVLAFSLSACGDKAKTDTPQPTEGKSVEDIMTYALNALNDASSMSYDMEMIMDMAAENQTVSMNMTGKVDYIKDPLVMKMNMNMDMGDLGSVTSEMYAEEVDGKYMLYTGMDNGQGNMAWTKQEMTDMSQISKYDAKESMDLYITSASSFKENGTEEINGMETTRYDGIITGDALNKVMDNSGVLDSFAGLGTDEDTMKSMLTDIGDLPISIWVEKDTGLPARYSMDMTDMMQKMMDKALASSSETSSSKVSIDKVEISMTMSNFNKVENIKIPDEAKNAK